MIFVPTPASESAVDWPVLQERKCFLSRRDDYGPTMSMSVACAWLADLEIACDRSSAGRAAWPGRWRLTLRASACAAVVLCSQSALRVLHLDCDVLTVDGADLRVVLFAAAPGAPR